MESNLVLVVHGIGEQAEGETLDALVGGAVRELPIKEAVDARRVMVAETRADSGQLALFPVHIRETAMKAGTIRTKNKKAQRPAVDQNITAAEVYWSDLSPAPSGAFATVVDMFRVVLGLGYLALDNIENNGFHMPLIAWSVRIFVWIFYTLIAPMNLVLLLGALALLVDPYLGHITDGRPLVAMRGGAQVHYCSVLGTLGLFIMISSAFWFKMMRRNVSYLVRSFMRGYAGLGTLIFVSALILGFGPAHLLTNFAAAIAPADIAIQPAPEQQKIAAFVSLCMYVLGLFWLAGVVVLLVMTLMSAWVSLSEMCRKSVRYYRTEDKTLKMSMALQRSAREGIGNKRLIYLAICTAMLLLWMLFSTAFWSAFAQLVSGWKWNGQAILLSRTFETVLGGATHSFSYILLVFLLVLATGAILAIARGVQKHRLSRSHSAGWQDVWLGRLILNPVLNILLVLGMALIVTGTLYVGSLQVSEYDRVLAMPVIGWFADAYVRSMENWAGVHTTLSGALSFGLPLSAFAGVLVYNFAGFFAAALGVGRDIVIYSTRSHAGNPVKKGRSSYLFRQRIEDRFSAVLRHMTRDRSFDRIIVVAHSQGTVIAARGMAEVRSKKTPAAPVLVTMGSPLSHVYGHYFSAEFQTDQMVSERSWINIFRRDDFVGTRVWRKGAVVHNHPVTAKGHTNYWTDRNVWRYLRRLV